MIKTLGELKKSGYQPKSVKQELRDNLIIALQNQQDVFEGVLGYNETVIPDLQRAILSKHNALLLGLRGQAKTRLARWMVQLLDDKIPIIKGSEINDDPLNPISAYARNLIEEKGDKTPISWIGREERYVEKLATPDVSVADLIGDIDPIKAANLKLTYADERVMHFGLIPRAHRGIFVINELPDLQPRIQVSLFNILQEGDLQIRGFNIRLPLDIQFLFTANPEDYTNRGSIITPLKDRIESQILTHYPEDIHIGKAITEQEFRSREQQENIHVPELMKDVIQWIVEEARQSEYTDIKSGVSARLGIAAYENLISTIERRMIINKEKKGTARLADLWGVIPAITGKVELVYEGEEEGPYYVALVFIQRAILKCFDQLFPHPDSDEKGQPDPYGAIKAFFSGGHSVDIMNDMNSKDFTRELKKVAGLQKLAEKKSNKNDVELMMELILHGLASHQVISRSLIKSTTTFKDELADMWSDFNEN